MSIPDSEMVLDFLQQVFFALLCLAILYTSAFTKKAPGEWTALINYCRMPEGLKKQSGGGGMIGCSVYTPAVISKHFTLLFFALFPSLPHSAWHDKVFDPAKTSSQLKQNNKLFPLGMEAKRRLFSFFSFPSISIFYRHKDKKDRERDKLGFLWN